MTNDFIDEQVEVVELKKTVKKSSKESFQAKKANSFEIAGVQVQNKKILTEQHRLKIAEGNKGKIRSEETRRKISEANKGKNKPPVSEETRRKMSEVRRGKKKTPMTEEHKKNLSLALKGRVNSEESIRKMREKLKGRVISDDTRKKLSESLKGRVIKSESIKKQLETLKARPLVEAERRRKISEAHKLRDYNRPVITPNGQFISKQALKLRLVADGVTKPLEKIHLWFKIYPNDFYYVNKNFNKRNVDFIDDKFHRITLLDDSSMKLLIAITNSHKKSKSMTMSEAMYLKTSVVSAQNHLKSMSMLELGLIEQRSNEKDRRVKFVFPSKLSIDYFKSKASTQKQVITRSKLSDINDVAKRS